MLNIQYKIVFMETEVFWGSGEQLTPLQMAVRSFSMFFILLTLIRIGGMRIFGKKTAFDSVLVIMLGAVLARGVVGASPFISTVAGASVLVAIHKILGQLAMRYTWVDKIVKGEHHSVYKDGKMNIPNMKKSEISEDDLKESIRLEINSACLDDAKELFVEKNGHVSVVRKTDS